MPSAATQTIAVWRAISSRLRGARRTAGRRARRTSARRARGRGATPALDRDGIADVMTRPAARRRPAPARAPSSPPPAAAARAGRATSPRCDRRRRAARADSCSPAAPPLPAAPSAGATSSSIRRVDLRLARDVDAARRLVEHEHVDVVMQQSRERHLLLVAARQLADRLRAVGAADREAIHPARGRRDLPRRPHDEAPDRTASSRVSVRLSATLKPERQPFALALLAEQAHALRASDRAASTGPGDRRRRARGRWSPVRGRRSRAAAACGRRPAARRCPGSRRDERERRRAGHDTRRPRGSPRPADRAPRGYRSSSAAPDHHARRCRRAVGVGGHAAARRCGRRAGRRSDPTRPSPPR